MKVHGPREVSSTRVDPIAGTRRADLRDRRYQCVPRGRGTWPQRERRADGGLARRRSCRVRGACSLRWALAPATTGLGGCHQSGHDPSLPIRWGLRRTAGVARGLAMPRHRPSAAATCGRFGTAGVAAGLAMTCRELSEAGVGVRFATGGVVVGLSRVRRGDRPAVTSDVGVVVGLSRARRGHRPAVTSDVWVVVGLSRVASAERLGDGAAVAT